MWRARGHSAQGAAHLRTGVPCQDHLAWGSKDGGRTLWLAVSDGHGGAAYTRSGLGAKFATEAARAAWEEMLSVSQDRELPVTRDGIEHRTARIVELWRQKVEFDLDRTPLTFEERAALATRDAGLDPQRAYGATLLTVLLTRDILAYLQLGDGDILEVGVQGEVHRPLERDTRLFANETTSLCGAQAWRDFRVAFRRLGDNVPSLILVSSDGYANSFRNDAGFCQVGKDLLNMIRSEGLDEVARRLPEWLEEASRIGSGDDVTLGILCSEDDPAVTGAGSA